MTNTSLDLRDKKIHDFCCSGVKLIAVANGIRHGKKSNSWQYGHSISLKVQFLDIEAVKELFIFGGTCRKEPSRKFDKILHQDKCC